MFFEAPLQVLRVPSGLDPFHLPPQPRIMVYPARHSTQRRSRRRVIQPFRRGEVLPEGRTTEEEVRLIALGKPPEVKGQRTED